MTEEPCWPSGPRTAAEFGQRIERVGLGRHADAFMALARPSVRLTPDTTVAAAEAAGLRLGGRPLLPPGHPWPRRDDGQPLSLIAQVRLADVQAVCNDPACPAAGTLAFFYDAVEQSVWGFSPTDSDAWAVVHSPDGVGTLRDFPDDLGDEGRFPALALAPSVELTFPPPESYDVERIMDGEWPSAYWPVLGEEWGSGLIHRFLGHPDPVQGDMQGECQLASHGVYVGDGTGHRTPEGQRLLPGAAEWRLLLQVDSETELGMQWGDCGRIYWLIRERELAAGEWQAAWLVLQCS